MKAKTKPMGKSEKFALANGIDFFNACHDFMEGADKDRDNHLSRIGDRIRLIDCLEQNGYTLVKLDEKIETTTVKVDTKAIAKVVNFDRKKSWVRWHMPDWSGNGNVDLPEGNWMIVRRVGNEVTLKKVEWSDDFNPQE